MIFLKSMNNPNEDSKFSREDRIHSDFLFSKGIKRLKKNQQRQF